MMGINELNAELCRALGVTDLNNVNKVTLIVQPNEAPRIVVQHLIYKQEIHEPMLKALAETKFTVSAEPAGPSVQ